MIPAAVRRLEARLAAGESELAILASDDRWETLYHLAPHRRNLLEWYPFPKGGRVLERHAEGGALTGLLLERSSRVVAVEAEPARAALLSRRHGAEPHLEIRSTLPGPEARFETIVDVTSGLSPDAPPPDVADLATRLAPGGRLLLGVPGGVTPSLAAALRSAGLRVEATYYPFPDLWMPEEIFSDALPPGRGSFPLTPRRFDSPAPGLPMERTRLARVAAAGAFGAAAPASLLVAATI